MKLMAEMAASESMAYIFDETYKEIALNQFEELGETILEISEIPQVKEAIMLPALVPPIISTFILLSSIYL